jgi:hypothetical protein
MRLAAWRAYTTGGGARKALEPSHDWPELHQDQLAGQLAGFFFNIMRRPTVNSRPRVLIGWSMIFSADDLDLTIVVLAFNIVWL